MVGMERLQDSQLVGRCVTSDLTEVSRANHPYHPPLQLISPAAEAVPTRRRVLAARSARHQRCRCLCGLEARTCLTPRAGITLLTRTAPLLSEQQASDLCFLMFRNLPVLINGCSHFSSSSSNVSGPNLVPLLVTLLLNLFRRLRFASGWCLTYF